MTSKYRVQRVDHSDCRYELHDAIFDAWAGRVLDAAKQAIGEPHGRHHFWAKVWCLGLGKSWMLNGLGKIVVEQKIRPRRCS